MPNEAQYVGDPLPANCELIEVHVAELQQLFNAIDPSPFREKDLSANVEAFIMSWAKDVHRGAVGRARELEPAAPMTTHSTATATGGVVSQRGDTTIPRRDRT